MECVIDQHSREVKEEGFLSSFVVSAKLVLVSIEGELYFAGSYALRGSMEAEEEIDPIGPISGNRSVTLKPNRNLEIRYKIEDWSMLDRTVSCKVSIDADYLGFTGQRRIALFERVQFQGEVPV